MLESISPAPHGSRRFGLDLMRAAAIGMVLASHLAGVLGPLGLYGVELFFVLSGFLIGGILIKSFERAGRFGRRELVEFLRRRWYRTLPNYFLFLVLFALWQQPWKTVDAAAMPYYLAFLQNLAWPMPEFFNLSWSLCVEEWFYLTTSATLFIAAAVLPKSPFGRRLALAATIGLFVAGPVALRFWAGYPPEALRKIVVCRLDAIVYGVLMAAFKAFAPGQWPRTSRLVPLVGVGLAVASFALPATPVGAAGQLTLVPLGLSLLLPFFDGRAGREGAFATAIERVSVWSYSMYLSHIIIYLGLMPVVGYDSFGAAGKVAYKAAAMALVVVASAANYRFFEKPTTELRDR